MSLSIYKALLKSNFKGTIYNLISNCVYPGQNGIQLEGKFEDGPVHKTIYASGNSKRTLNSYFPSIF